MGDRRDGIEREAYRPVGVAQLFGRSAVHVRGGVRQAIAANGPEVDAHEMVLVSLKGHNLQWGDQRLIAMIVESSEGGYQRFSALQCSRCILVVPDRILGRDVKIPPSSANAISTRGGRPGMTHERTH